MAFIGDNSTKLNPIDVENIGSFANLILSEVPVCNDLIIREKLASTLREFCRETDACTVRQDLFVHGNQHVFQVTCVPMDMVIGNVLDLTYDGRHVSFRTDTGNMTVIADERAAHGVHVVITVSVVPAVGGEKCPKWFKRRYAEAICSGTLYHLLSMTKKPWSDPNRSVQYAMNYRNAIAEASYQRISNDISMSGSASAIPYGGPFM